MRSFIFIVTLFVTFIYTSSAQQQQCCMTIYDWSASFTSDVFIPSGDSYTVLGSYFYSNDYYKIGERFSAQYLDGPHQGQSRNGRFIFDFSKNRYYSIDDASGACESGLIDQKLPPTCYGAQWGWKLVKTVTLGFTYKVALFANTTNINGLTVNSTEIAALNDGCIPIENFSTFRSPTRNMTSHTILYNLQNGITDPTIFSIPNSCPRKSSQLANMPPFLHQVPFTGSFRHELYF
eukprot:TRINITY_DN1321_c0_g1_i3.p1 TRINITY_DN1321_c0_g1~~TRINITY_DN1321_c0_g1_i3.p1  ORF type:complete len:235 (-),score=19.21 TRINITY_DN1321_c0_g1_i3:56-760(-)